MVVGGAFPVFFIRSPSQGALFREIEFERYRFVGVESQGSLSEDSFFIYDPPSPVHANANNIQCCTL